MPADSPKPSLTSIALTFASISSTAFGGGQKASVRQQVLARGWMDREKFMDGLEIAEVLPGPNILNLAIYCGQRVRGIPGAVAAFLGASIPPFIIVLIAGALYFKYASNPFVAGGLRGCALGALGLTLGNALELTWDERGDWLRIALLVVTTLVVTLLVIFGGAGIVHEYLRSRRTRHE
jgi:chromate transporter